MTPKEPRREETAAIDELFEAGLAPTEVPPPPEPLEGAPPPAPHTDHARELQLEQEEQERTGQFLP